MYARPHQDLEEGDSRVQPQVFQMMRCCISDSDEYSTHARRHARLRALRNVQKVVQHPNSSMWFTFYDEKAVADSTRTTLVEPRVTPHALILNKNTIVNRARHYYGLGTFIIHATYYTSHTLPFIHCFIDELFGYSMTTFVSMCQ